MRRGSRNCCVCDGRSDTGRIFEAHRVHAPNSVLPVIASEGGVFGQVVVGSSGQILSKLNVKCRAKRQTTLHEVCGPKSANFRLKHALSSRQAERLACQ
jgi:hypothetical protein